METELFLRQICTYVCQGRIHDLKLGGRNVISPEWKKEGGGGGGGIYSISISISIFQIRYISTIWGGWYAWYMAGVIA